ncbi:hypothetical protein T05_2266 [Trichinella murrelli]|uniref:Uncharacterized protein n=1 Tax=Trichinella murrelli TaxID=144512 RepID=A0A0V0TW48_9BILA|nr:hypothetical protein T05_2266 [Trichinella murrelli]
MTILNIQEQKSTSFQQFYFSLIEMIAICVSLPFQFADHFIDKVKNAISVKHRLHFWNTEWIFVPRLRGYPSALPFALPAYYQHLRIDKRSDKAGFLKWQNSGDVEACGPLAHVHVCHHNQALFGFTERKRFSKRRPL